MDLKDIPTAKEAWAKLKNAFANQTKMARMVKEIEIRA